MEPSNQIQWQEFVDQFGLAKTAANPWDAETLAANIRGSSSGEKQIILFLLHDWNPNESWPEKFDCIEAFRVWDDGKISIFLKWANNRFWP